MTAHRLYTCAIIAEAMKGPLFREMQSAIKNTECILYEERGLLHAVKVIPSACVTIRTIMSSMTAQCNVHYNNLTDVERSYQPVGTSPDASSRATRPLTIVQVRNMKQRRERQLFRTALTREKGAGDSDRGMSRF